ncbi:hypothetical protein E2C01_058581 [Portunus trituberculatus]|uniref:Uncharacterized protein n=1 Tax=Portunus trituberculatus TaxID=210409 RepID=A0A5B7H6J1_PORTR|nr:hypothetical protein [Portunus trituberculatus]
MCGAGNIKQSRVTGSSNCSETRAERDLQELSIVVMSFDLCVEEPLNYILTTMDSSQGAHVGRREREIDKVVNILEN